MAGKHKLDLLNREFSERLDQFESEWLSGKIPDIAAFIRDAAAGDTRDLSDLIEIDLEYRWKQFRTVEKVSSEGDRHFPAFPKLEDYLALLPEQSRTRLLVSHLIAEEYRVRTRWGDRPGLQSFVERFPDDRAAIEATFARIDTDFENEEIDPHSEDSSQSMIGRSTVIFTPIQERPEAEIQSDSATSFAIGSYQIETKIGQGSFGEVWKAYDPMMKRYVAIKFPRRDMQFPAEVLRSFESEAQKLATIRRIPGIVTVFACGASDGIPYIVSEIIEGENLERRMRRFALSYEQSAHIIAEVASSLHRANTQGKGLVHRDIKPSNILLDAEEQPFVADFGLAIKEEEQFRESHAVVGTFAYMSPEQARGESQRVDGRADIYALGVVLYQLLTGRLPFLGQLPEEYIDQILHQEPRPPRSINDRIPVELERICLKCLSKSISDRYTTAGDLAKELRSWQTPKVAPRSHTKFAILGGLIILLLLFSKFLWPLGRGNQTVQAPGNSKESQNSPPAAVEPHPVIQNVAVITEPAGAQIVVYPLEDRYGFPDGKRRVGAEGRSPVSLQLEPGMYLVVAVLDDGRFHEVYRTVPQSTLALPIMSYAHYRWRTRADGTVEWPEITIPAAEITRDMGLFEGSPSFQLGDPGNSLIPVHRRVIKSFYLDPHETSWGEFLSINEGQTPASLHRLGGNLPPLEMPIAGIWYDDALMYAEKAGKRIPTEAEYEFAATAGGTRRFPWGDDVNRIQEWNFGPVGTPEFDQLNAGTPVFGLYSNVAEWTSSWGSPYPPRLDYAPALPGRKEGHYIVRGGAFSIIQGKPDPAEFSVGPRGRISLSEKELQPGLGFRCARSVRPRLESIDLERVVRE